MQDCNGTRRILLGFNTKTEKQTSKKPGANGTCVPNATRSAAIVDRQPESATQLGRRFVKPQNPHSVWRGRWKRRPGLKREFHTGCVAKTHQDLPGRLQVRLRVAVLTKHTEGKQGRGQCSWDVVRGREGYPAQVKLWGFARVVLVFVVWVLVFCFVFVYHRQFAVFDFARPFF